MSFNAIKRFFTENVQLRPVVSEEGRKIINSGLSNEDFHEKMKALKKGNPTKFEVEGRSVTMNLVKSLKR